MPIQFKFVSAFTCERILREKDDVLSAIRLVDVFFVPEDAPAGAAVQFYVCVTLKTAPAPEEEVTLEVTLVRPTGERERVPTPGGPSKIQRFQDDPSVPVGVTIIMLTTVRVKDMGTHYLEVTADGELAVTIPFTLLRPKPQAEQTN